MRKLLLIILTFFSINTFAQSTSWNEYKLKEHWKTNGADEIEGIYENTVRTVTSPKYSVGLVKTDFGYTLVFLKVAGKILNYSEGYKQDYTYSWNSGDVKAYLTPSATPSLFKVKWYMSDKTISQDLYISFEKGFMKLIWTDDNTQNLYLKIYPNANDNISQSNSSPNEGSGTGFAISSNGIIVTNYHVIENAKTIKIRGVNSDFNKTYKAKVLVSDKNNDLALIQIDDYSFTSLGTIPFALKTKLANVGESIFALGYPLRAAMGDEIKLTNGIISSKTGFQGDITSYQVSAPVQPGNSGGPLFDNNGNVIGVINAKLTIAENASYAVKISYLKNLIDLLNSPPKLPTVNTLTAKSLASQVQIINKFVYIIETE